MRPKSILIAILCINLILIYSCSNNNAKNNEQAKITLSRSPIKGDSSQQRNPLTVYISKLSQEKGGIKPHKTHKFLSKLNKKDTLNIKENVYSILTKYDSTFGGDEMFDKYSLIIYNNNKEVFNNRYIYSMSGFEYMPETNMLTFSLDSIPAPFIYTANLYLLNLKTNSLQIIDHPQGLGNAIFYNHGQNIIYINGFSLYSYSLITKTKNIVAKIVFNKTDEYPSPQLMDIELAENGIIKLSFFKDSDTQLNLFTVSFDASPILNSTSQDK